jgi:hypothetical protein
MPSKIISVFKISQTETENLVSDRDNIFEERITTFEEWIITLETIVQSINLKFDQILTSLAVQRLPFPFEIFKSFSKSFSTAETITRDIDLFDPFNNAEAVRNEK